MGPFANNGPSPAVSASSFGSGFASGGRGWNDKYLCRHYTLENLLAAYHGRLGFDLGG